MKKTPYEILIQKCLSAKLKEIRLQQHLTQEQMAEKMNIAPRSYSNIENNKSLCKISTLFYYLEEFENPGDLINDLLMEIIKEKSV